MPDINIIETEFNLDVPSIEFDVRKQGPPGGIGPPGMGVTFIGEAMGGAGTVRTISQAPLGIVLIWDGSSFQTPGVDYTQSGQVFTFGLAPAFPYAIYPIGAGGAAGQSMFGGGGFNISAGSTVYCSIYGNGAAGDTTEPTNSSVIVTPSTFKKLYVKLDAAPGIGKTVTVTLRKNGVDTLLVVSLTGAAQVTAFDITDQILFAPDDTVSVKIAATAGTVSQTCAFGGLILY